MIKSVIFDMDGVLINSEPLWQKVEIEVFRELGIHLTPELQIPTKGLRTDEMVSYWYTRHPWIHPSPEEVVRVYENRMIKIFEEEVELINGVENCIRFFYDMRIPIALASSSTMELIDIFLNRFGFRRYFSVIYSAEKEQYGKPHPGIFLEVANLLNCDTTECLVIEDSFHGLIAAKAAKMKVIAMPDPEDINDPRYGAADYIISGLDEINKTIFDKLNS